jgi:hypothetical protein
MLLACLLGPQKLVADPAPDGERDFLTVLCDLVVPDTDTPGAVAAGAPDWIPLALAHGLPADAPPSPPGLLGRLRSSLNAASGADFVSLPRNRQIASLTAFDDAAYGPAASHTSGFSEWRTLKSLILTAYYTSRIGAVVELQYDLDPGHWNPDVPLPEENRAWSSDWTAVTFG